METLVRFALKLAFWLLVIGVGADAMDALTKGAAFATRYGWINTYKFNQSLWRK